MGISGRARSRSSGCGVPVWQQLVACCTVLIGLGIPSLVVAVFPRAFSSGSLSVPTIPSESDDQLSLPPYTVRPFPGMFFHWDAINASDGTWIMNGTFNFTNGEYVAVGLNSDKKMDGFIVICNANQSADSATCYDFIGSVYTVTMLDSNVVPEELQAITTAAASANGITMISFSKVIRSPKYNVSIVDIGAYNRMIFARGAWGSRAFPLQHTSDDRNWYTINFVTGDVVQPVSANYRYVLYPAIGIMVASSAVLRILISCYRVKFSDRARWIGVAVFCIGFAIVVAAYIVVHYTDYKAMVTPKASFRAVGQGGVLIFSSLLLPVGRRFFFSDFFGISPERALKFHIYGALLLIAVLSIHAVGMWYQYGTAAILRWSDRDAVSRLPGLLAYTLILVQVAIGLLRHYIGYETFRAAHYLYMPIIFLVCAHASIACYGVVPAIALHFATNLYKRFFTRIGPNETILNCTVNEETQTVVLEVVKYDIITPGSWYFITLPDISRVAHPFSVYRVKRQKDEQSLTFLIQNSEAQAHPTQGQKPMGRSWTAKLMNHIRAGKRLNSYRLDGPYGILEHDLHNYYNYILVAGGVGITMVGNLLHHIADAHDKIIGRADAKTNLLFVWVVRHDGWLRQLGDDLATSKITMKRTCKHLKTTYKVFVTGSDSANPNHSGDSASTGGQTTAAMRVKQLPTTVSQQIDVIRGRRPNFAEELQAFEVQQKKFSITSTDGLIKTEGSAVMYVCGPSSMTDDAVAAAHSLKDLCVETHVAHYSF